MLQIGVAFSREAVAPLVPDGFEMTDGSTGGFYVYEATEGWGVAPFTSAVAFLDIKGHDSADGSRARLVTGGFYSVKALEAFRTYYRFPIELGSSHQIADGDEIIGVGSAAAGAVFRLTIRPVEGAVETRSGLHTYTAAADGRASSAVPVAFSYRHKLAQPVTVEIANDAPEPFGRLAPKALLWALFSEDASFTLGTAAPFFAADDELEQAQTTSEVLHLLSESGLGTIIVDQTRRIQFVNAAARPLLGDGLEDVGGLLGGSTRADQELLSTMIEETTKRSGVGKQIAVERSGGRRPLLVRAVAMGSIGNERACAVFITDPGRVVAPRAGQALQLMGLTRSEARVASLVGAGVSPKDAAKRIGNTEGTVRVTLGRVYDKLNVGRQSELALLVSRLG